MMPSGGGSGKRVDRMRGGVSVAGDSGSKDKQPQFTPRLGFHHLAEEYEGDQVCYSAVQRFNDSRYHQPC